MKTQVHPVVAVLAVAVALGAVWFCYTFIFHGKVYGQVGPPASARASLPSGMGGTAGPHKGAAPKPQKAGPPHPAEHAPEEQAK